MKNSKNVFLVVAAFGFGMLPFSVMADCPNFAGTYNVTKTVTSGGADLLTAGKTITVTQNGCQEIDLDLGNQKFFADGHLHDWMKIGNVANLSVTSQFQGGALVGTISMNKVINLQAGSVRISVDPDSNTLTYALTALGKTYQVIATKQ